MDMNGGQALVKALECEGTEVVFGLPGGAILPVYDPIIESPLRHILVRHEQGAGHMAEGYAHATGRPGVVMITSGPGATNVVTALCDAYMDSVPVVCITGQVPYAAIGTDAFQECDTTGITMAVTKHNFLVTEAQDIPRIIHEAFHIATTGRPGPVLVDIPKDIVDPRNPRSAMTWYEPTDDIMELPGYRPATAGDPELVRAAAELICTAERPVIYAGGGILKARAAAELLDPRRADRRAGGHHADGPGVLPRQPRAVPGHARHARQLHRGHRHAELGPADRAGCPLRRPGHRPPRRLRARRQGDPRGHRRGRAGQGPDCPTWPSGATASW